MKKKKPFNTNKNSIDTRGEKHQEKRIQPKNKKQKTKNQWKKKREKIFEKSSSKLKSSPVFEDHDLQKSLLTRIISSQVVAETVPCERRQSLPHLQSSHTASMASSDHTQFFSKKPPDDHRTKITACFPTKQFFGKTQIKKKKTGFQASEKPLAGFSEACPLQRLLEKEKSWSTEKK